MKTLLTLLLATLCAANSYGQTLKSLMYNTTNGQVIANTGTNTLTFTNAAVAFGNSGTFITSTSLSNNAKGVNVEEAYLFYDSQEKLRWSEQFIEANVPFSFNGTNVAQDTRANLGFSTNLNTFWTATNSSNARSAVGLGATWLTNTNAVNFRSALELSAGWLTNTNAADFRTAIGLGSTNDAAFNSVSVTNAATTRTNIGLPLAALTNTSNVTIMRALSGSTNTNQPYSGTIELSDGTQGFSLQFSNGILLSIDPT